MLVRSAHRDIGAPFDGFTWRYATWRGTDRSARTLASRDPRDTHRPQSVVMLGQLAEGFGHPQFFLVRHLFEVKERVAIAPVSDREVVQVVPVPAIQDLDHPMQATQRGGGGDPHAAPNRAPPPLPLCGPASADLWDIVVWAC